MIELHSEAAVEGTLVRLGDVARVHDATPEEAARLADLVLAPLPRGRKLTVDGTLVRDRLRAAGIDLSATEFTGRARTVVTGGAPSASEPRNADPAADVTDHEFERASRIVEQALVNFVRQHVPELGEVRVETGLQRGDVPAILEGSATGFRIESGGERWTERQAYRLRFLDRREQLRDVLVEARVTALPYVLAVRHAVPKGHVLRPEDLQWKQVAAATAGFTRVEDAVGREVTRTLRADQIVAHDATRSVPLVRANEVVSVFSTVGAIRVKTLMKARRDGAVGDLVPVVSLDGRRTISARVTGYHEAEVTAAGTETAPVPTDPAATASVQFAPPSRRPRRIEDESRPPQPVAADPPAGASPLATEEVRRNLRRGRLTINGGGIVQASAERRSDRPPLDRSDDRRPEIAAGHPVGGSPFRSVVQSAAGWPALDQRGDPEADKEGRRFAHGRSRFRSTQPAVPERGDTR